MTSQEFLMDVRGKHGSQRTRDGRLVNDLDDKELMTKMLERYPGERDNIDDLDTVLTEDETPETPVESDVQNRLTETAKEMGLGAKLFGRLKQAGVGTYENLKDVATGEVSATQGMFRAPLRIAGALGGAVSDVVGAAVSPVIEGTANLISDIPAVQDFAQKPAVSGALDTINETGQKVGEAYSSWKESNPDGAQDVEDLVNTAGLTGAGSVTKAGLKTSLGKTAVSTVEKAFEPSQLALESRIQSAFEKSIKPNLGTQKTPAGARKYKDDTITGLKVIDANKNDLKFKNADGDTVEGRSPESLQELTESIEQTKKKIYDQYDDLAVKAGDAGVQVDTIKIGNELEDVINNKALKLSNPQAVKYAEEVRDRFVRAGTLDAKTAQEVIQQYNNSLQAFYRNPTPEGLTRNAVDALMANQVRRELDNGIAGLTGENYQKLKSQYGALKTIENDVLRATLRDARKNAKGLIDYSDIFSGGQLVSGLLSMNPAAIASGVAQKGISSYFKFLNDPNRAVRKMFDDVGKLDKDPDIIPISTRKQIEAPAEGAAQESNRVPIRLGEKTQSSIDQSEASNPLIERQGLVLTNLPAEVKVNIKDIIDDYRLNKGKDSELQQDAARIAEDLGIRMPKTYGALVEKLQKILDLND